jgi:hypothetical protein
MRISDCGIKTAELTAVIKYFCDLGMAHGLFFQSAFRNPKSAINKSLPASCTGRRPAEISICAVTERYHLTVRSGDGHTAARI